MAAKVFLKKNEERRIKSGHLWIFSNEIAKVEDETANGDLVEIYDSRNNFLGGGFYNGNSLIAVRIISRSAVDDLYDLLKEKITSANNLRKEVYPERNSYRMVFSESDFLPGLIIDKYNGTFVMQVYSAGMHKNIGKIINILKEDFSAENIFTKNEEHFRRMEGLIEEDEIFLGEMKTEIIDDGKINYKIDFEKGHKTGFYFDQSDNRFFIEKLVKNKSVVDAFCNSGGFGLHAVSAGAASVCFVDSSSSEIENVNQNFRLNNFSNPAEYFAQDVFEFMQENIRNQKYYDVVMIDPPAFAKSKKNLPQAKKGYEKLNKLALQITAPNGYLITSSCSHHLSEEEFLQIINSAAVKANKKIQLIHSYGASLDHPKIPAMKETSYLKFAVFKVL